MQKCDCAIACADEAEEMEAVESDVGSNSSPKSKRGGRKFAHQKSRSAPPNMSVLKVLA